MTKPSELMTATTAVIRALENLAPDEQTRVLRTVEAALQPISTKPERKRRSDAGMSRTQQIIEGVKP